MPAPDDQAAADAIAETMADNPGVASVSTDGVSVSYDRQNSLRERAALERRAARAAGTRPTAARIDLSNF